MDQQDSIREIFMNDQGQIIYWDDEWEELNRMLNRSREEVLARARELGILKEEEN